MKKLLSTSYNKQGLDLGILLIRVTVAAMMLAHGIPKMITLFSGGAIQFPSVFGLTAGLSLGLAVFAEVVCSVLILAGLGTRFAVIPLAITMMVAAFSIHAADPFAKKELALHYLVAYAALFFLGSGRYSLDHLLQQPSLRQQYTKA